jgi:hypothetical protein
MNGELSFNIFTDISSYSCEPFVFRDLITSANSRVVT